MTDAMKALLAAVYAGGDDAVAAVRRIGEDWRLQLEAAAEEIEKLRPTENERAAIESLISEEYRRGAYFWADTLKKFLERVR